MKKIMKVKNVLMAMVFSVAVLGGYQAYEQVSLTNVDSFLLENVEALATSSDDDDKYSKKDWNRYPYTNDNGTPGLNCTIGGSENCLLGG